MFQLAGDASARKYFRVVVGDTSYVLMFWDPFEDEETYPFLNVLHHFAKHGVQVPKVISVSKTEGLVLLEDLGDLTLERKFWENQDPETAMGFYKQSIDEIVKIHYSATRDFSPKYSAFKIEFNVERLLWELNYAREHLLEKFLKVKISDGDGKLLTNSFTKICQRLHDEPKFIAHRDYHSRNLMIKNGRVRVIDFQDARLGAIQYDLVSLLRDSYVNMPDQMQTKLLDYYLAEREKLGGLPKVNRDHFDILFEVQSIQRCLKACGSFASFYNTRNDTRYLKYLKGTLVRVQRALDFFPEYKDLKNLLKTYGLFEKDLQLP